MKRLLATLSLTLLSTSAIANYGVGVLSKPFEGDKKKLITAEMNGVFNNGKGMAMQARYKQQLAKNINLDAGVGAGGGERASRFFIGTDIELYPDTGKQPRISVRPSLTRANEFSQNRTILGVAPTISKGYSFWGKEAYPFVALPVGLNLTGDTKSYETQYSLSTGVAMNLPLKNYNHLVANVEMNINLKDSFHAAFMGISYPFE